MPDFTVIDPDTFALFFAASVALGLAPGPDNLFVLTQAAVQGRAAGLLVTLGLCTGLFVHTALVAVGVAAVLRASAIAFTALKLVGAAYLLWLAWQALRAAGGALPEAGVGPGDGFKLYLRGVVMNVTNPKVAIFFLAFLPQFVDAGRGEVAWQIVQLGVVFQLATLLVFGAVALGAGALGDRLRRSARLRAAIDRLAAAVFVALAIRLVLTERV